jgi:Ca2+-binding RTX toxin-like protein
LTFNAATREFSGTPPLNFNGFIDVRVTASDGVLSVFDDFRVTISAVNDAPIVAIALVDRTSAEDVAINFTLPATSFTDVDNATLALTAILADGSTLPTWLTFNASTRAFTGTPPLNFSGFIDVRVTANDGTLSVSDEFRLTVTPVNDAPVLATALVDITSAEDTAISFTLPAGSFTDVDSASLTLSAKLTNGAVLPTWLTFNAATRQFSGTPPLNYNGFIDIRVTASDGVLSAFDDFRVTISAVNDAPVVGIALVDRTSAEDVAINFVLPATSFTDVDSTVLTLSATLADGSALPVWLAFNATTRAFTGTPPLNFNGFVEVRVTATDGTLSISDEFRLTVSPVNDAPIVAALLADRAFNEDTFVNFALPVGSFTDVDNSTLTLSAKLTNGAVLPTWLVFDAANQRFSGTPPLNYNGYIDVRVTASDGVLSAFDDFRVTINAINDAPIVAVALIDRNSAEDVAINFTLPSTSFTDVDSSLLNLSATLANGAALPAWLLFNPTTRAFTGTPPLNFNGFVDVRVTASDGTLSTSDEFRLTVTPVNDAPVGVNDSGLSAVSGVGTLINAATLLANDTDVDGNVLTITAVSAAIGGTAILNGAGQILYTPTNVYQGIGGFTYTLSDGTVTTTAKALIDVNVAWVYGTPNAETLNGAASLPNRIDGGDGNDTINGGSLKDELLGGMGNDMINGAAGNDTLSGGEGDDVITGGVGNDIVDGGSGADTLVLSGLQASYSIVTSGGSVSIVDNQPTVDGNDGTDTIVGIETLRFKGGATASIASPIILDLDGNGVETLSAADTNARYDLDGDGLTDDTSWFGQSDGMLFLDRDGNGKVTNAGEFSFTGDVPDAKSDLEGLRAFDSNKDGILSALDTRFGEFRVWQDKDSDGVAEASEILTLTAANVKSINLVGTAVNATTQIGDVAVLNKGSYTRTNGTTMEFIDAALTYYSSATNMPELFTRSQKFDRKASKYTIDFANGEMKINTGSKSALIDARSGVLGASNLMTFKKKTFGLFSPIVLDLDGNGLELRSFKKSRASFDMNGDGASDNTGWISNGDGFLVIDRNKDGKIDHASELSFGTEGTDATSGLGGLAALDSNGDQVIDAKDGRFKELKIWVDANGDGVTDTGELKTLAEIGIKSISLKATNLKGSAKIGQNAMVSTATFTFTNGLTGTLGNTALAYVPGTKKEAEATSETAIIPTTPASPIEPGSALSPTAPIAPEEEASLLTSLRAGLGSSPNDLWSSRQTGKNASYFGGNPFDIFAAPEPDAYETKPELFGTQSPNQTGPTLEVVASQDTKTQDFPATKESEDAIDGSSGVLLGNLKSDSSGEPNPESHTQDKPAAPDVELITDLDNNTGASDDRIVMQMIQDLAAFGGRGGFDRTKLGDGLVGGAKDWFA